MVMTPSFKEIEIQVPKRDENDKVFMKMGGNTDKFVPCEFSVFLFLNFTIRRMAL